MTARMVLLATVVAVGCDKQAEPREIFIPAGNMFSGAPWNWGRDNARSGFKQRYVHAFYADRLKVTKGEYLLCVVAGPCPRSGESRANGVLYSNHAGATFDDARTYCAWRGKRLPTTLEFERMARGTDGWASICADEPDVGCSEGIVARSGVAELYNSEWVELRNDSFPYGAMMEGRDAAAIGLHRRELMRFDPDLDHDVFIAEPSAIHGAFRCVRSASPARGLQ